MKELGVSGESSHHSGFMSTNLVTNVVDTSKLELTAEELYEMIPCGIIWCSVEEEPKVLFCNTKAASYMDLADKDVTGDKIGLLSFIDPNDRVQLLQSICGNRKTAEGGLEVRMIGARGSRRWLSLTFQPFAAAEDRQFVQICLSDITERRLYKDIANEVADGIYIIDRENYDLLYANESAGLFLEEEATTLGKKCYKVLQGKDSPCEFCTLSAGVAEGEIHEMYAPHTGRTYATKIRHTEWNGAPAFVKYVTDITEEKESQREKERLEVYYQTLIKHLPGGLVVTTFKEGTIYPEFFSEGFAAMMGMTVEDAFVFYKFGIESRIHLEERKEALQVLFQHIEEKTDSWESVHRLQKADGSYIWVRNISSLIIEEDGMVKIYAVCSDVTYDMKSQQELRQRYNDMLFNHYKSIAPNEIISGHCNVTKDVIIDITDTTKNDLLNHFGYNRDDFFSGVAGFIVDSQERRQFLERFLTKPMAQAYAREETKHELECFVKLPNENRGRYVHISVILISSPETGDIMGFLSVLDVTEMRISSKLFQRLAEVSYDFIADVDLKADRYKMVAVNEKSSSIPFEEGSFIEVARASLYKEVLPKDLKICKAMLDYAYIRKRLQEEDSYSFHYSLMDESGNVRTKNMLVFSTDGKLDRICLARVDVTESVREQQGLLNMLAYTFELAGFLDVTTDHFVMYTRKSVLENLAPYSSGSFTKLIDRVIEKYCEKEDQEEMHRQLSKETMLQRLQQSTEGYDLTFRFHHKENVQHKQFNILWGDETHKTICLVRADVTDVLTREQQSKEELKNALVLAQEANRAKSDFLSSMSHDIRTPMNAIIGMTDLAIANRANSEQIDESLSIIKNSSEHLLRLINDILDMSRIESGRMVLAKEAFNLRSEMDKLAVRSRALAEKKGLVFTYFVDICHDHCIGDLLRLTKILENLLGNSIKFTPPGGRVSLTITELPSGDGKRIGWYRYEIADTGVGIEKENLSHIFEPFYRTESSTISRTEGSGLGLSIVKNIIDYKGGTIDVKSTPAKGTTFYVELPIHFDDEQAESPSADLRKEAASADFSGIKILLVEDNKINQLIAVRILESAGAQVSVAANGREGLERFEASEKGRFDIIMMDIQMPVMNGYDAARVIRSSAHPQAQTIPIIAMTANVFADDVKKCLDAGMDAHIAKPIDTKKLYGVINEYWEKRKGKE